MMGAEAVYSKLTGKRIPIYVNFQITNKCNLKCEYCYADFASLKGKEELTTEEVLKLIDELSSMGTRWVRILGGEPLLRKDIGLIIDKFKKKKIMCEMVTNGYFVKNNIEIIKKVDSLCFSIDGDREATDLLRGKGTYDKVIEAIKIAKENKIPIRLHGVLTKYTIDKYQHIAELAKEHGGMFNYAQYLALPYDKNYKIMVSTEEAKDFFKKIKELKHKGYPVLNSNAFYDHVINWPLEKDIMLKEEAKNIDTTYVIPCKAGRFSCWIDSDGGVYSCQCRWKKGLNLRDVGFKRAWDYLQEI